MWSVSPRTFSLRPTRAEKKGRNGAPSTQPDEREKAAPNSSPRVSFDSLLARVVHQQLRRLVTCAERALVQAKDLDASMVQMARARACRVSLLVRLRSSSCQPTFAATSLSLR